MRKLAVLLGAAFILISTTTYAATPKNNNVHDSIYFVVLDRFVDGNPANNGDGYDPTNDGYFHGGDLAGLDSKLSYIKDLGFSSIWITPIVKQKTIQGSSAAYHGYWGIDFTTVDPHFGTEADFSKLIADAHAKGLKIILDIVVNHTADVIQYDASGKPFVSPEDATIKKPEWLNDLNNYHNLGNTDSGKATMLTGDFYGLDDLKTESPVVQKGWTDLWISWIQKFKFDGFRIDTAQYVDANFWNYFIPRVLAAAPKGFQIFGEVADTDPDYLAPYIKNQSFPSLLDFPVNNAVREYLTHNDNAAQLGEVFKLDKDYKNPNSLVTFVINHDMGRISGFISLRDSWQGDEAVLKKSIMAQDLLFTIRGEPTAYYGDEIGLMGSGGDKQARQDFGATQVEYWKSEPRLPADVIAKEIIKLQALRAKYSSLANGIQKVRLAQNSIFAFTRYVAGQEVAVAFNTSDKAITTKLVVDSKSGKWIKVLGDGSSFTSASKNLSLTIAPYSSVIVINPSAKI